MSYDEAMAEIVEFLKTHARVGPREYLVRLTSEYGWSEALVQANTVERDGSLTTTGVDVPATWYVAKSLLRPHPPFDCAGDEEARAFCDEIAAAMCSAFGIGRDEAIGRINRHWAEPGKDPATEPRVWIVGLDPVYHEEAEYWASTIYFGHDSFWWLPDSKPTALPWP